MKKYIFIFTLSTLFLLTIRIVSDHTSPSTQIIINTPSLNSYEMVENIQSELSKIKGISYYELSLPSSSVLINYDDKRVDENDILAAFNKWGCKKYEISYNPIF